MGRLSKWLHNNKLCCNITPFTVNLLSMHVQLDWAYLKAKAHASATVTSWLAPIVEAVARNHGGHLNRMRALMLWGFDGLWQEYRNGWKLSDERAEFMEHLRKATLSGYHACSKSHHAARTFIYPIIPKHHHFDHLLHRRFGSNPRRLWFGHLVKKALAPRKAQSNAGFFFGCQEAQEVGLVSL